MAPKPLPFQSPPPAREVRAELLIAEAKKWIGTKESQGDNKGPDVEEFQKAVDGVAAGEPWCMAFVQFCLKKIGGSELFQSEHCLTVWNKTPVEHRRKHPVPGVVVIWRMKGTLSGHAGIVTRVNGELMRTIEGNTGPGAGVVREGDGVYEKSRSSYPTKHAKMELLGFLWPWISGGNNER